MSAAPRRILLPSVAAFTAVLITSAATAAGSSAAAAALTPAVAHSAYAPVQSSSDPSSSDSSTGGRPTGETSPLQLTPGRAFAGSVVLVALPASGVPISDNAIAAARPSPCSIALDQAPVLGSQCALSDTGWAGRLTLPAGSAPGTHTVTFTVGRLSAAADLVVLTLPTIQQRLTVPGLVGHTVRYARRALRALTLRLRGGGTHLDRRIATQNPAEGTRSWPDGAVDVTVVAGPAKGSRPAPVPSTSPIASVSPPSTTLSGRGSPPSVVVTSAATPVPTGSTYGFDAVALAVLVLALLLLALLLVARVARRRPPAAGSARRSTRSPSQPHVQPIFQSHADTRASVRIVSQRYGPPLPTLRLEPHADHHLDPLLSDLLELHR